MAVISTYVAYATAEIYRGPGPVRGKCFGASLDGLIVGSVWSGIIED